MSRKPRDNRSIYAITPIDTSPLAGENYVIRCEWEGSGVDGVILYFRAAGMPIRGET
jgi:hypothetical protein